MGCYSKPDSAPSTRPTVDVGPAMLPTPATGSRSGRTDRREDRFIVLIHDLDYVILRSGRTTQNDEENLLQARAQESWTSAIGDEVQFLGGPEKERGRGTASHPLFFPQIMSSPRSLRFPGPPTQPTQRSGFDRPWVGPSGAFRKSRDIRGKT